MVYSVELIESNLFTRGSIVKPIKQFLNHVVSFTDTQ